MQAALKGNLTTAPELTEFDNGTQLVRCRVGSNNGYRDKTGKWVDLPTLFVTVEAWGPLAIDVAEQCHAGQAVIVLGEWRHAEYEKDGEKRHRQFIVAQAIGPALGSRAKRQPPQADAAEAAGGEEPDFWSAAK